MRTTLTIDDYLMKKLKEQAHRSSKSLKQVVNETIRAGLQQHHNSANRKPYKGRTYSMGYPTLVSLDKALSLSTKLEDEEIRRKLSIKK